MPSSMPQASCFHTSCFSKHTFSDELSQSPFIFLLLFSCFFVMLILENPMLTSFTYSTCSEIQVSPVLPSKQLYLRPLGQPLCSDFYLPLSLQTPKFSSQISLKTQKQSEKNDHTHFFRVLLMISLNLTLSPLPFLC